MFSLTSLIKKGAIVAAVVIAGVVGLGASASAAQIPYVEGQPLPSIANPVFNTYTNIPYGVGDESDFVRIRPSTGDPTNNGPNGERNALFTDPLNASCNVGEKFDVRTYIHNGADSDLNGNGSGSAVAHGTRLAMTAPLGQTSNKFVFSSTISATNAATVVDRGTLNCGSNVQLKLVPNTVKVHTRPLGWYNASDSSVNGSMSLGTHVKESGDVWGCWAERTIVVYVVEVVEAPKAPVYTCDLLSVTKLDNRKYKFDVKYTAKNGAVYKSTSFDYGDGQTGTDSTHTYSKDGTFNVVANVIFTVNGQDRTVTGEACAKPLTVTPENCPVPGKENYPKDAPECKVCDINPNLPADDERCKPAITEIPNTGAGSVAGLFAAVTAAGAVAHRYVMRRRLNV